MNTKENQKQWIEEIHNNILFRGRSKQTFLNYRCALNRFFKFYDEQVNLKKLKEKDIIIYLKERLLNRNVCTDTYNLNLAAIKLFYAVCFNKSFNSLLLPRCKNKKRIPTIIDKQTFIMIFNKEKNLNHKCWFLLAFCCGLRVEEVATIKIENIISDEHKLKVLGKGNKERFTILPDIVIKFLRLYYQSKNLKDHSGCLFKGNSNREKINSKTIINYFTEIKNKYHLNHNITFHSLRHSFATYYLMNGGDLITLKTMMGHKNLNTTTIYLHLSQNFNKIKGINYGK